MRCRDFRAMSDACAGRTDSSRSIGAPPTGAPIGSIASGQCVDEFEDGKGVLSVPTGEFPGGRRGDPRAARRPAAAACRNGRLEPRLGRGALCPVPGGIDELVDELVWAEEREAIVPGVSLHRRRPRRRHARRGGAAARRRRGGTGRPDALVCHPGTHNKWAVLRRRAGSQRFRTVMTGELFNLLKQHSILADLLQGEVAANDAFGDGVAHALANDDLPAELFSIRARWLLGKAETEACASYASGLLIGSDVKIGLPGRRGEMTVMGRPGAHRALRRRHPPGRRRGRGARRRAMLPRRQQANRGKDFELSAIDQLRLYLDQCPLIAIIRGVTPDEAEAIGDAIFDAGIRIIEVPLNSPEPLEEHRKAGRRSSATARWSAPARCFTPANVEDVKAAGGRLIVSPAHQPRRHSPPRRPQISCHAPATSRRPKPLPRSMPARPRSNSSRPRVPARRSSRRSSRSFPRRCRFSSSAG